MPCPLEAICAVEGHPPQDVDVSWPEQQVRTKINLKISSTPALPRSHTGPACMCKEAETPCLEERCVYVGEGKSTFHGTSCQSRETAETGPTGFKRVLEGRNTQDTPALKITAEASLQSHQWQWGWTKYTRSPLATTQSSKRLLHQDPSSPVLDHSLPSKEQDCQCCWQTGFTSQELTPGGTRSCLPTHIQAIPGCYTSAQSVQQGKRKAVDSYLSQGPLKQTGAEEEEEIVL